MEELQEHFVAVLKQCIDIGMKLPFIVCAVSPNGSVLATRINEGRGPDTLAQHFEDHAFKTPVNIMVVDHDGEAARVVIKVARSAISRFLLANSKPGQHIAGRFFVF